MKILFSILALLFGVFNFSLYESGIIMPSKYIEVKSVFPYTIEMAKPVAKAPPKNRQVSAKIPIDSLKVFDLSGAWGLGTYSTYGYFDSQGDPKNGDMTADNTNGDVSIGDVDYFMPSYRNHRLLHVNLERRYEITEIWMYKWANQGAFADTVDMTTGDSAKSFSFIYNYTNNTTHPKQKRFITTGGSANWVMVWSGMDTTQYFLLNLRRQFFFYTAGGYYVTMQTNMMGLVIYGRDIGEHETKFNNATDGEVASAMTYRQNLRNLTGSNFYNQFQHSDLDSFTVHRKGIQQIYMFSNDSLVAQPQQDISSRDYHDSVTKARMVGRHIYYQIQGPTTTAYVQTGTETYRPVNDTSADRRNPLSYTTMAKNCYNYGYYFGSNASANDAYAKIRNGYGKAHNIYYGLEPGNEYNGVYFPNYWLDPIAAACLYVMCIDGWNNKWGPGYGVKNADPNMKFYLPATAGLQVHYQRAVLKLMQLAYDVTNPPINVIGFHLYEANKKKGIGLTSIESVGSYVTYPSSKGFYQDRAKVIKIMFKQWKGYIDITLNEYGADKQFHRTTTENGQYDTSFYGINQYDSYTPDQSLGIYLMSSKLMTASLPFFEAAQFSFKDDEAPDATFSYHHYSGSGYLWYYLNEFYQLDSTRYFANWYYDKGLSMRLFEFKHEQTLDSTSGGRFIMKFRSIYNTGKVAYAVWEDDSTSTNPAFTLNVGSVANAVLVEGSWTSLTPTETPVVPVGGQISGTANSKHKIYIMEEMQNEPGSLIRVRMRIIVR